MTKQAMISTSITMLVCIFLFLVISGCEGQGRGFALPHGDKAAGAEAFIELACNECHSIRESVDKLNPGHAEIHVELGGIITRVRTYGDLVTSIINPSHRIAGYYQSEINRDAQGNSTMRIYNDVKTVQLLVDLTTFLETTYEVVKPQVSPIYAP